jgi:hypothetical protein
MIFVKKMTRIGTGIRKYRIVCFVELGACDWEQGSPGFGTVGQWASGLEGQSKRNKRRSAFAPRRRMRASNGPTGLHYCAFCDYPEPTIEG